MKKKIKSKIDRPRLYVFRSNQHIYAQVIDDTNHLTIVASSSLCPKLKTKITSTANCQAATLVGQDIGYKLKNKGITSIVFDRGKHIYHGRIKALADATRNTGINF